jgi:formylglycine-generating enzyme required for sulfatase activity
MIRAVTLAVLLLAGAFPARAAHAQPRAYTDTIPGTLVTFEMVPVPGGTVTLEAADGSRTVEVAPFHLGRTEVTWDMYDVFALGLDAPSASAGGADAVARPSEPYGAPDYGWGHAGYPVISVTRAAAAAFCDWLSARTGHRYRLPTEAEWQHAAELARPTSHSTDIDDLAWHAGNADGRTHPVGSRAPDALGLHDLFGNAAEWVTSDAGNVTRGGSFRDDVEEVGPHARAAQHASWSERDPQLPKSTWWLSDGPFVGFRIVREH